LFAPGAAAILVAVNRILPIALILAFVVLAVLSQERESVTVDEYAHLPASCAVLRHGTTDLYGKNPPLVRYLLGVPALLAGAVVPEPALSTLGAGWDPWTYGDRFVAANAGPVGLGRYPAILRAARLAGVGLGVTLLVLLYLWARSLHGAAAASITLTLAAFCPTLLAHAPLVTVDAGGALFLLGAACACWHALRAPSPGRAALAGAAVGLAVVAKFTALVLLPLLPLWWFLARRARLGRAPRPLRAAAAGVAAFLLVVHAAYQFRAPLSPLGSFRLHSGLAGAVARVLPAATPVPLPASFVRGLDGQMLDLEQAEMPNYLNGSWSRQGWWYYYPQALLQKTPLALWGLAAAAIGFALVRWRRGEGAAASGPPPGGGADAPARGLAGWMISTLAVTLLAGALGARLDIGIRYLLPLLPLLYLLLGGALAPAVRGRQGRVVVLLLLAAYAGVVVAAFPGYLPFFNSLAGGTQGGWRYLANSNLDWGQDLAGLARYLDERRSHAPVYLAYFGHLDPARYGIDYRLPPDHPVAGLYAVSVNLLLGMPYVVVDQGRWALFGDDLTRPQNRLAWLRAREPLARIGGSIWIYEVPNPP